VRDANASKRIKAFIGASDLRPYIIYNNIALCQRSTTFTLAYNVRWVTILLYNKHLVRSHLEYCNSVWAPYKKTYIDKLKKVQKWATKMIPEFKKCTILADLSS